LATKRKGQTTRKPSYALLESHASQLQHDLWLTQIALQCVQNEQPVASETMREDSGPARYRFDLYRPESAHGGILVITFRLNGQSNSTTAHYFEQYRLMPSLARFERIACERLAIKRFARVPA